MNPLTHPALALFATALVCALLPLPKTRRLLPLGALVALFLTVRQSPMLPWHNRPL